MKKLNQKGTMKKLNQKGTIDFIFIAAIVAVAAVGYFVYTQVAKTDEVVQDSAINNESVSNLSPQNDSNDTAAINMATDEAVVSESSLPDGWVNYQNKDLGITFSYPEDFGDVVRQEFDSNGNAEYFGFSAFDNLNLGGFQNDYTTPGRDGTLFDSGGFAESSEGFVLRSRKDKSPLPSGRSVYDYILSGNGNCIASTEAEYYGGAVFHATCNLAGPDTYGYNFATRNAETIDASVFLQIIESVTVN